MRILILLLIVSIYSLKPVFSQDNTIVTIDFTTQKYIGDISELNREKYFSFHGSFGWELSDQSEYLFDQLGIEFGRAFSGPGPFHKSRTEVPNLNEALKKAENNVRNAKNAPLYKKYKTRNIIITDHPRAAFQLNADHEKIANYNAEYIKNAYPVLPKYYEVMNEPFVHAIDYVKTWTETDAVILQMSKLHKVIADKVHAEIPEIMVGGYSSAWPEMDRKNFEHWNNRMKLFMDTAGESMKFFATHLYDGRNVTGGFSYRSGSNSEAILDLIEAYSYKKWGVIKPHLISEYGYTAKGLLGKPYSKKLSGACLKSYNSLLMGFLDKPDRLLKAVPFIVGEAGWFYTNKEKNPEGNPYPWVIIRRLKNGSKGFTDLKKFFELWKDVKGKRIDVVSNNPDIQVNAFLKNEKAYIALNNLHNEEEKVSLDFLNKGVNHIKNITLRRLYTNASDIPKLIYFTNLEAMNDLDLKAGETVILECDLDSVILLHKIREHNYYSKTYLQKIEAQKTIGFTIEEVNTGTKGRAAIKMGIGRAHNLSKKPNITINGNSVNIPDNWAGYDQANREQFFGVINIPIDIKHTQQGSNKIEITFPDDGGHVSSVILNIEKVE